MYNEIKRRLQERISAVPRFSIERITTGDTDGERDTSLIAAHVTSELERHMSDMYDDTDASEAAEQPRDAVREFGGLRTQRQLEKHLVEQLSVDIGSSMKTFDFTVQSGCKFFGPPYDREWGENALVFGDRLDGTVIITTKPDGFAAGGIGFYLTTNEPVIAAITPQGTFDWNWFAVADLPFARSRGGLGITIYTNSEPQPTMSRQPVLWSASGMTTWSGQKGNGRIADAASPVFPGMFGPVPLAPALVNMLPGSRYLVWVWCWQISRLREGDAFIAFLMLNMPFVTICAGPPIVIR
jgi:hypothetical protein